MKNVNEYYKGLLFLAYLLINSGKEISDNELYYLHKMRVQEGMSDDDFANYLNSLIGKSEKEIYQIGIASLNRCPDAAKIRALSILNKMAVSDKVFNPKEVQFISYAITLSKTDINSVVPINQPKNLAA
ncbi:MAG: hypothetical protein RI909_1484 [Bacteroidota bacterium]|jgi:hypothetical protein